MDFSAFGVVARRAGAHERVGDLAVHHHINRLNIGAGR